MMMLDDDHPAQAFERDLASIRGRARVTVIALLATAANRVFGLGVAVWQNGLIADAQAHRPVSQATLDLSDDFTRLGGGATLVLLVLTGVLFLRWLHGSVRLARALKADTLTWMPADAVSSFIIPIVNIGRPYQVVRDLHDALAVDYVPEPPVEVRASDGMGYREVAIRPPPRRADLPHASIGAWWACFWLGNAASRIGALQASTDLDGIMTRNTIYAGVDALEVVSAMLAVLVVRAVTARLAERFRRVRFNSLETLKSVGIQFDTPSTVPAVSAG